MSDAPDHLRTDRLLLRRWQGSDLEPFAAINADPEVMRHFPAPLDHAGTQRMIARIAESFHTEGFGLWAVELVHGGTFLGFTGLSRQRVPTRPDSVVEVGWRFARTAWGHGYATEAARAALDDGFGRCGLDEIVSITTRTNTRSRAVMQRLGLAHETAADFDQPGLPAGHPLRPGVLYRMDRVGWRSRAEA